MAMVLPRVSVGGTLLTAESSDDPVTIPLFIGYTAKVEKSGLPVSISSLAEASAVWGDTGTMAWSLRHFFDNGGRLCYVLSLGDTAQWSSAADRLDALVAALQTPEVMSAVIEDNHTGLLLAPELSELNDIETDTVDLWYQGWQALLELAVYERRFALLELPEVPGTAVKLAQMSFSADYCRNAAAWWPRLETSYADDLDSTISHRLLSALPAVAAAIQRSAKAYGVWKAPANIALTKTIRPTNDAALSQTLFTQTGVYANPICSFPGKGVYLWGCRTLLNDAGSPWRFIQIRLLVNSIENRLKFIARAFVFEPNNALTWMKLKGQIWSWLRQQWLAGAFYGTQEEDAFSVAVGLDETMTADDLSAGKMIVNIQLALLAPAEFIDLTITLDARASATQFEESA
ncbi:phage tail sheath C-terminal domain-containing protein [Kosakonia sp. BYX6]|uniref:Phage tail sheath C-terminal domain-containing protein n=1 Tax=Kosakonia calanthes TaxID=3139408 RepID=A0ABZ3B6R8_9ENTR